MKNELFHIGPLTIYGYGTMFAAGVLSGSCLAARRAKRNGYDENMLFSLIMWTIVGGFAGSKLLYWLINIKQIMKDPAYVLYTIGDGFVVIGSILGGIGACYLCCRKYRVSFLAVFDLFVPSLALGQGFGRIGCFLAGCCYGKETIHFPYVIFHNSSFAPNLVPLVPVQLYASALNFANAFLLLCYDRRVRDSGKKKDGCVGALYLILYGTGRFFLEYLRGDVERGMWGIFSTSQILSIPLFLSGLVIRRICDKGN